MSHDWHPAIIDLDAVSSNFDAVCRKAKVPVMAVIKADAYGHGAVPIARLLENGAPFSASAPCPKRWSCGTPELPGRY